MKRLALWPIIQTDDGYFRYVNHKDRLLSTGFSNVAGLLKNTKHIRVDTPAIDLMRRRYADTPAIHEKAS